MMDDNDDLPDTDPVTPADTPSALLKLGLAVCPVCEGMGSRVISDGFKKEFVKCDLCDGAKRVTIEKAKAYGTK